MNLPDPAAVPPPDPAPARILCVDDEPSILAALRRVFRPRGYTILTAGSGKEALDLLGREAVDLVVSDMRMPQMDGAELLGEVVARWPDTQRILLTGYADAAATIAAINRGKIWGYVAKPWEDADLLAKVEQALEHGRLRRENQRLLDLTRDQNAQLRELNAGLEEKVAARTAELQRTLGLLEETHAQLKAGFLATVKMLVSLFELRGGRLGGHSHRVAEIARPLAVGLGLDAAATQDVVLAALLHDIGKLGLPDHLLDKAFNQMGADQRAQLMVHPARGEQVLKSVEQLKHVAHLVRHHHECFDGSGYPDHLAGLAIPIGARILAVANDFDALQMGTLVSRPLRPAEARTFILENSARRYDPAVVGLFVAQIADRIPEEIKEMPLRPGSLASGMVLTRDLKHPQGYLLLAKGEVVASEEIEQLLKIEAAEGIHLMLYVAPPSHA